MSRKFIYFINPISGTSGKIVLLEMLKQKTTERKIPFEILHTNAAGDYQYLAEKIRNEQITDVIICGGDGTVNQVANALQGIPVNIGIIPMGSGNGLAFAARIPKKPADALEVIFRGKSEYIDSFYINGRFSCMLCGLGFDAQVAHDFARQKKRGLATYVKQSTRNFFSAKPYPFEIDMDGISIRTEAFFISIANSNQFGNNFTIAPQASLHDGLLDIVVVNKMSKWQMAWKVLQQVRGGRVRMYDDTRYHHTGIHYFQAKKLQIRNPGMAPLHIDGDPATSDPAYDIQIIEKAFRLLLP